MTLSQRWLKGAYQGSCWLLPLRPLGALYQWAMVRREQAYQRGSKAAWEAPVPVIVVGNITLGGTGKSPLVAWLASWLVAQGWSPGIVSRGYGGKALHYPLFVTASSNVAESGDEPLMLAQQTGLPVVADPQRVRGVQALVDAGCDIILSDDGLQHLALARDIELVVVDGARGLGNGRCLPAGPLRESSSRLQRVDAVIVNGDSPPSLPVASVTTMQLAPLRWRRLDDGVHFPLAPLPFTLPVHAVAGIGHPERFFRTLSALGIEGEWHPLADHQHFDADALSFAESRPVIMTAKDAVKCYALAPPNSWVLDVEATLPPEFEHWLAARLSALS
ncbi:MULTISPECIES: tetraacyldisaccharide 4'-kinase [Halomonadaceae]|uniref:Tetraacyldisaccharide 4'-kinase n=1 Tax=Vreelandella titanicae TaxID=664683 RepID=A0A558J358_9GAMM|nr:MULTISPECIES: tetraacyldisaccharide 4'-kinase [Halomonas]MBR9905616.1 tetraacyldisaccharide 4'-kinase [Gammaproteobacteria bacterium]TVU87974.1 tetraacyldisaccharide 4'-kinase [Halomonas titanicae]CEP36589.1 Tetraacyldisaccharide 4'-kinase-Lipid A 4'-kinase [Halomonas sp. R57-5]